jgi:hypothetical protein
VFDLKVELYSAPAFSFSLSFFGGWSTSYSSFNQEVKCFIDWFSTLPCTLDPAIITSFLVCFYLTLYEFVWSYRTFPHNESRFPTSFPSSPCPFLAVLWPDRQASCDNAITFNYPNIRMNTWMFCGCHSNPRLPAPCQRQSARQRRA